MSLIKSCIIMVMELFKVAVQKCQLLDDLLFYWTLLYNPTPKILESSNLYCLLGHPYTFKRAITCYKGAITENK